MLSPSLTLVVVRETVTDTSFDTNPAQPTETTSNTGVGHSAYFLLSSYPSLRESFHRTKLDFRELYTPEAEFPRSPFVGNWVAENYGCGKLGAFFPNCLRCPRAHWEHCGVADGSRR